MNFAENPDPNTDLRRAKAELKRLKSALPTFPSPDQLYNDIVHCCSEIMYLIELIDNIKIDITYFFHNCDPWNVLERDAQIKELTVKNYHLRLRSLRQHLSLLFSSVPVMIATKAMSAKAWQSYTATPQHYTKKNGEEVPLLTEQSEIERILSDHEETIEELFAKLKDIREECLYQERYREDVSAKKICNALRTLNEQFSDLREKLQQDRLKMITEETQTDDVPLVPMDVEVIQEDIDNVEREGEQARIMDNAEYMEAIQEDAEEVELQENEQIMKDIALLEQDLALVQRRLEELSKERLCRPRTYEIGVDRDEEKMMPCAFCHVPGHHYSDSCREYHLQRRAKNLSTSKNAARCAWK
ncbi:hypothetical protein OSTOST_01961 [Ostertagia ostertagi]